MKLKKKSLNVIILGFSIITLIVVTYLQFVYEDILLICKIILQVLFLFFSGLLGWTLDIILAEKDAKKNYELLKEFFGDLERTLINSDDRNSFHQINEIKNLLEKTSKELPAIFEEEKNFEPKSPEFSEFIAAQIMNKIIFNNGILNLKMRIINLDFLKEAIKKGKKIELYQDHGMSQVWINVMTEDGDDLGVLEDPFYGLSVIRSAHIFQTLIQILQWIYLTNNPKFIPDENNPLLIFPGIDKYGFYEQDNTFILHIDAKKIIQ